MVTDRNLLSYVWNTRTEGYIIIYVVVFVLTGISGVLSSLGLPPGQVLSNATTFAFWTTVFAIICSLPAFLVLDMSRRHHEGIFFYVLSGGFIGLLKILVIGLDGTVRFNPSASAINVAQESVCVALIALLVSWIVQMRSK